MENVSNRSDIVKFDKRQILNKISDYINIYCSDNDIIDKDIIKYTQIQFSYLLVCIYENCISIYDLYKDNKYDFDKLDILLDIYLILCKRYNKVPTNDGYISMCGINYNTFMNWSEGRTQVSNKSSNLIKRLYKSNESALSDKLLSKDVNPVGAIAILNHKHNWSVQETVKQRQAETIPLDQIAQSIGVNLLEMSDKKDNSSADQRL